METIWTDEGPGQISPVAHLYPQRGAIGRIVGRRFRLLLPKGFLIRWHRAALPRDLGVPNALARKLSSSELTKLLRHGSDDKRTAAAEAFRSMGYQSRQATEELLAALLEDPLSSVRWRVLDTLRKIGISSRMTPALICVLRDDPSRSIRWRAAEALGQKRIRTKAKAEALIRACGDQDSWVRWHAERVLNTAVAPDYLSSHLINHYRLDSPPGVRAFVFRYFSKKGTLTTKKRRQLILCGLRDTNLEVRGAAAELLLDHPDPSPIVVSALRNCLISPSANVRVSAMRALQRLKLPDRSLSRDLRAATLDPDEYVRKVAYESLAFIKDPRLPSVRLLTQGLTDPNPMVRETSAMALCKRHIFSQAVLRALAERLQNSDYSLRPWRSIIEFARIDNVEPALRSLPWRLILNCIAEDVAEGVLPTIGLRIWPNGTKIRFPNKEGGDLPPRGIGYPWVNAGVCHSWEQYEELFGSQLRSVIRQACFSGTPFPRIHLVLASQFIFSLPIWMDGKTPPAHIEGRPVSFIIEGGGKITNLPEMKSNVFDSSSRRTDFLYATKLQWLQYAMYAGLSDSKPVKTRSTLEVFAANQWQTFVKSISDLLAEFGLEYFVNEEWFDKRGWESSRYGRRYERTYDALSPNVVQFFKLIRSPRGKELRRANKKISNQLLRNIELAIWTNRLSTYPPLLLAALASGLAGDRVAFYASAAGKNLTR